MDVFDAARWLVAFLAALFCALTLACNVGVGLRWVMTRQTGSGVPLFGSIAGALAILIAPVGDFAERLKWCLVPFALECANWWLLWVVERRRRNEA